jgi:small conductance mechanosensitive channel
MEQITQLVLTYGPRIVGAIIFVVVGFLLAGWLKRLVVRGMERAKIEPTLCGFLGSVAKWGFLAVVLIACLGVFGVETTSFAAVLGASALAIGLAFQGSLSNLAAGVMLMVFRPFKAGDVISVSGHVGKVAEVGLFCTKLDTPDNRRVIVPNSGVFGATIENMTHHETRRVDVSVGTEYPADLDQARSALLEAAKGVANVMEDPAPQVVLLALGDSSIDWAVRVWTATANYWEVRDALTRAAKMALDQAGIGIPFPQMDVHLDSPVTN